MLSLNMIHVLLSLLPAWRKRWQPSYKKKERLFSDCLSQNKISYRSNVWIRFQLSEVVGMGSEREGRENKSGGTVEMEVWSH